MLVAVALGLRASWMYLPVACAILLVTGSDAVRGRESWLPPLGILLLMRPRVPGFLGATILEGDVARVRLWSTADLLGDMLFWLPTGRTLAMVPLVVLGGLWAWRRSDRSDVAAGLLAVAFVVVAMPLGNLLSQVNGGYYIAIVEPVILGASGAAVANLVHGLVSSSWRWVGALALASIAGLTAWPVPPRPPLEPHVRYAEVLQNLVRAVHAEPRPVVTNIEGLSYVLAWYRAQAGLADLRDALPQRIRQGSPGTPVSEVWEVACSRCAAHEPCRERLSSAWVLLGAAGPSSEEVSCHRKLTQQCQTVADLELEFTLLRCFDE
jgi:hypothetical protein